MKIKLNIKTSNYRKYSPTCLHTIYIASARGGRPYLIEFYRVSVNFTFLLNTNLNCRLSQ